MASAIFHDLNNEQADGVTYVVCTATGAPSRGRQLSLRQGAP
jgi:hypothetical protein